MDRKSKAIEQSIAVLKANDRGEFTLPSENLYPHQWLWDSCFIAIGLRHLDIDRAKTELRSLKRGKWSNGMLAHMIFDNSILYTQDRATWNSKLSEFAPEKFATSGITQPPVLAEAVLRIGNKLKISERRSWYKEMLPTLIDYHEWMYRERDPNNSGLVFQVHPYETGLDSTPPWLQQLHRYHQPWWASLLQSTGLIKFVNLIRRDLKHVPSGQRMDNLDALLYYHVIMRLRSKHYKIDKIIKHNKYLIQDLSFNSILVRANECLVEIADTIDKELPDQLLQDIKASRDGFEQFWDNSKQQYYSRNFATGQLVRVPSIATLMPLYSGCISAERAEQLVSMLRNRNMFGTEYPVASVPVGSRNFKKLRYWQGPSWVNTNWMIINGLERYGYKTEAEIIRQKTLELVANHGCYEYFSPIDGTPAGAKNFSWTAALALDLAS